MVFTPLQLGKVSEQNNNELDFYDVSTYHIKLYAAKFQNKTLDSVKPDSDARIIAESGVTAIGIEDLEFETFWGFQAGTYTSFATTFTFTLKEPLGATMLDQIKVLADELGIENFIKMPFFLEIGFRGRNRETGDTISPNLMPVKRFAIHIIDMKLEVDKGGTIYTCKAVRAHDYAHSIIIGTTNQTIVLDVVDLQDAITKLQDNLNGTDAKGKEKTGVKGQGKNDQFRDKWTINIDPEIAAKGAFVDNPEKQKSSGNNPYLEWDNTKTAIHIPAKSEMGNVIDLLMLNTRWLKDSIKDNEKTKIHKIKSTVKIIGYDHIRNDYVRDITLDIVPVLNRPAVHEAKASEETALPSDFIGELQGGNGTVAKSYNYIFTGKNYHVINFEFKLNLAWFTMLPRKSGSANYDIYNPGLLCEAPNERVQGTWFGWMDSITEGNDPSILPPISVDPVSGKSIYADRTKGSASGVWPQSFCEAPVDQEGSTMVESSRDTETSYTASLFRNYIEESRGEFILIDVEVRGDPFWLTASNTEKLYFIFSTGMPQEVDMNTGQIPLPSETLITGLFQIRTVKHSFSNGKFIQILNGVRDPLTKITKTKEKSKDGTPVFIPFRDLG